MLLPEYVFFCNPWLVATPKDPHAFQPLVVQAAWYPLNLLRTCTRATLIQK